jgi:hypothetical protein
MLAVGIGYGVGYQRCPRRGFSAAGFELSSVMLNRKGAGSIVDYFKVNARTNVQLPKERTDRQCIIIQLIHKSRTKRKKRKKKKITSHFTYQMSFLFIHVKDVELSFRRTNAFFSSPKQVGIVCKV